MARMCEAWMGTAPSVFARRSRSQHTDTEEEGEEHIKVEHRLDHDLSGFEMVQHCSSPFQRRLPTKCKFCNVIFFLKM
jgi:hypothetical protein